MEPGEPSNNSTGSPAEAGGDGGEKEKKGRRKLYGKPFVPGDPRINLKGRPPMSQQQREFMQALQEMRVDVLNGVRDAIAKRDPSVLNKLMDKLGGADAINVRIQVEKEQAAFLAQAKKLLPPELYEQLLAQYASEAS